MQQWCFMGFFQMWKLSFWLGFLKDPVNLAMGQASQFSFHGEECNYNNNYWKIHQMMLQIYILYSGHAKDRNLSVVFLALS